MRTSLRFFALAALLALFCHPAAAQEVLDTVQVTGVRVPIALKQSARMVTVLDSVAIASIPATSVNDLLKHAVGVDVRQRGAEGMQTDISIRGGTCDQIAILINGIPISDPQTGHNAADFPFAVSEIERIEILEGPAARAYGTSSLLGAVNIVTRKEAVSGAGVHLESGSHALFSASASGYLVSGAMSNQLSVGYARSDGYTVSRAGTPNSDFGGVKAFYQGSFAHPDFILNWQAGLSNRDFGSNTFYSARFDDQFEHTLKTYTAIQAETFGRVHLKPSIYWNHGNDRFELVRGNPDAYPYNYHRTNVLGANLGGWFESGWGKTAFGAEVRNEDIISTNLGEPLDQPIPVRGTDATYKVGLNRTDLSLYLEHNVVLPRFTFSAGATLVYNTGNSEGVRLHPGADVSYRISDSWKLFASYNSAQRMPTFTELYYSVGGHQADKNLRAEKMQAVEGGVKYLRPGIRAIATVYYHHGTDMIDWIKDLSVLDAPWTSVNHAVVNSLGEELTLRLDFPLLLARERFLLRDLNFCYAHINQYKAAIPGYESYYALEYLRNKFVIQAGFTPWKYLNINVSWRLNDRVGSYRRYEDGVDTGDSVAYAPYSLLDAKISWDAPRFSLWLSAENLLNTTYIDHGNVPQPGLWLKLGVTGLVSYSGRRRSL